MGLMAFERALAHLDGVFARRNVRLLFHSFGLYAIGRVASLCLPTSDVSIKRKYK